MLGLRVVGGIFVVFGALAAASGLLFFCLHFAQPKGEIVTGGASLDFYGVQFFVGLVMYAAGELINLAVTVATKYLKTQEPVREPVREPSRVPVKQSRPLAEVGASI